MVKEVVVLYGAKIPGGPIQRTKAHLAGNIRVKGFNAFHFNSVGLIAGTRKTLSRAAVSITIH